MESLRELYKIGHGPSSSHTMGPAKASEMFLREFPDADSYRVFLYGSLALTGRGHMTDVIIMKVFEGHHIEVVFDADKRGLPHANTMEFYAYRHDEQVGYWRVYSVGGGTIHVEGHGALKPPEIYKLNSFARIKTYCTERNIRLWQYVEEVEGPEIWDYLGEVWKTMKQAISDGLRAEGTLQGGLNLQRKAGTLYNQHHMDESSATRENRIVCAYAFAVSEQNASLGEIVTAPTCGSCGIVPAVLRYIQERKEFTDREILHALATGGLIGNLIKKNASISGAECGCQAEVGSACSMAAAAAAEAYGMDLGQIEYAAEVAMEHHLGLTCDPVNGLVQIPCIERNAVAAMRAINAVRLANFLSSSRKISFDMVVETMYNTGRDMAKGYRETSQSGLAATYVNRIKVKDKRLVAANKEKLYGNHKKPHPQPGVNRTPAKWGHDF